jgi:hypothetical protein
MRLSGKAPSIEPLEPRTILPFVAEIMAPVPARLKLLFPRLMLPFVFKVALVNVEGPDRLFIVRNLRAVATPMPLLKEMEALPPPSRVSPADPGVEASIGPFKVSGD